MWRSADSMLRVGEGASRFGALGLIKLIAEHTRGRRAFYGCCSLTRVGRHRRERIPSDECEVRNEQLQFYVVRSTKYEISCQW